MAAPARPGVIDARVPCPLCGGLVHPVAGRCKHCKGDLTTFRAGRAPAPTPLPPLLGGPAPAANGNGHTAVPAVMRREESAPILPPRQSAHGMPAQREHSMWRRWPVIVMIIAGVAIVGAVIVMFALPPSSGSADSHTLKPPPAPERMETAPLPPPSATPQPADPWGAPHAQAQPTPRQAPIDPDPDPGLADPFASPGALQGGGNLDFVATFGRHLCDRLSQCGASSPEVTSYCNLMKAMPVPHGTPTCGAAKKCLDHVDQLSCSIQTDDQAALGQLMTQLPDCIDAITRC